MSDGTTRQPAVRRSRGQVPETTPGTRLPVTLLYVPGDRPDRVRKALDGDADTVVIDLEDAVAPAAKPQARDLVREMLSRSPGRPVQVRVNALDSPWGPGDLRMLDALPPEVDVRVPKADSPEVVARVADHLDHPRRLHCLLESPLGVERAFDIARCHSGVATLALGEADLRSAFGPYAVDTLAWCRARVVVAARAAGLPAPVQSVWTAVRDLTGLERSCRTGRKEGFVGRAAIHPAQLPVIRAAYRPDPADVEKARTLVERVRAAQRSGTGTVVTGDGEFLDEAMVAGARQLLRLADSTRE